MNSAGFGILALIAFVVLVFVTIAFMASRYKRCPSDKVLVIYGRVEKGRSSKTMHGGGAFVWPLIQDYAYLSLTPITISIPLEGALSLQNIRINVPSTFTVGVSTVSEIMSNAAERILHLQQNAIEEMAKEIIFGQLRLTVASLTIEQINQDRESFLESIRRNVEPELNKIGLQLINVNITDITDASNYISSIGKKAASEAINQAKIDVAQQTRHGAIGEANAVREQEIKVAEAMAEAEIGRKTADANQRKRVQEQEADAVQGENTANANISRHNAELEIQRAQANADAEKGKKTAEADQRIFVQEQESKAIKGENTSKASIAEFNAELEVKRAAALKNTEVARYEAQVDIQQALYKAEQARLRAEEVVRQEIEKDKIEIAAEAEAERIRREARGEADGILAKYQAEAEGVRKLLESKAEGYRKLIESVGGDAQAASTFLMIEKIEELVSRQVEAISNLKIDKITVWDSGGNGDGSSTSNFISNLFKSLPPLQEISQMAGFELPEYLGKMKGQSINGSGEDKSIDHGTATELPPNNNKLGPQDH
ncbi:MAG TPA: SPFH domain-containing protein [Anaerolineales bacterium]|jgi:flotillin|nr:SPFH domain-containing protein [Anaerolineales bacterium]